MIYLDRLISTLNPAVSVVYSGGNTTWTLPFSVPTDNSEGTLVLVSGDDAVAPVGTIVTSSRPGATTIRHSGANYSIFEMYVGVLYSMDVEFSTFYPRNRDGGADTRGVLQLRGIELNIKQADQLSVTVTQPERTPVVYAATAKELSKGEMRVPLLGNNEHTVLSMSSLSALGCRLLSLDWEGFLHIRNNPR